MLNALQGSVSGSYAPNEEGPPTLQGTGKQAW